MVPTPKYRRAWLPAIALLLLVPGLGLTIPGQVDAPDLEWGEDIKLSESNEASDDPTVALMPDGGMVVAWRERLIAQYSVFFVILDEDGKVVGQRQQLGADLAVSMDPTVAVDSTGRLHFVWTALEDQELWYARASQSGTVEVGPDRLTDAEGDSAEASIWMDSRDHLHIVWFDGRQGLTWLYYMQLDRDGNKVVDDTPMVVSRTEQESAIVMDSRGDLHVVWNSLAPAGAISYNSDLHYTKVASTGDVLIEDISLATSRGNIGFPDIAVDLANDIHVVYPEGLSVRESINYIKLDASGRTILSGSVQTDGIQGSGDAAIAADGNNRLHLVWSQGVFGNTELHYQTWDLDGDPLGDPVQLTDDPGNSRYPTIGLSSKGEPRIAWSDWRSGNAEIYLKVATLPVQGVDVAVYSRDISFDPSTVTAGEEVNITFVIHNQGDARVDQTQLEILLDGAQSHVGVVHNLPPGGSTVFTLLLTVAEGDHTVSVTVDPLGEPDIAEHNNVAARSFIAHPPGTLIADAGPDIEAVVGSPTYLDATGSVYRGTGVLSFEWDFGDGSESAHGEYVEHVYQSIGTYTVAVTVSDGVVDDTDTCQVKVMERDDPPVAVISPEGPLQGDRLIPVQLSASSSTDDSGIVNNTWNMGDGTVLYGSMISHQYTELGIFAVTLNVVDTTGQVGINRTTIEVVNRAPEVGPIEGPQKVEQGKRVAFTVSASDLDGDVAEVGWDFDRANGITFEAIGAEVSRVFEKAGTFNITCIVRDGDGGQTVVNMEVKVTESEGSGIPSTGLLSVLIALLGAAGVTRLMIKGRTNRNI
jgi:PKD repeat protein